MKISFSAKKVAAIAEIQMSFSSEILGKDNEKDVQNENSILKLRWIKKPIDIWELKHM